MHCSQGLFHLVEAGRFDEFARDFLQRCAQPPVLVNEVNDFGANLPRLLVNFGQTPLLAQVLLEADRARRGVRHGLHLDVPLFQAARPRLGSAVFRVVLDPVVLPNQVVQSLEFGRVPFLNHQRLFAGGRLVLSLCRRRGLSRLIFGQHQLQRRISVNFLCNARFQGHHGQLQNVHCLDELRRQALLLLEKLARNLRKNLRHALRF